MTETRRCSLAYSQSADMPSVSIIVIGKPRHMVIGEPLDRPRPPLILCMVDVVREQTLRLR